MKISDVRANAYAMPLTSPAYSRGPYRFVDREFLIVTYRTDPRRLRALVPEPLQIDVDNPIVKYEFIRMPDSSGFGDYTESGQVIPVTYEGRRGMYVHSMYLDCHAPTAGGREMWGFPKKIASPTLEVQGDALIGELRYGKSLVATATMGFKYAQLDAAQARRSIEAPGFLLKIVPHVDGTPRVLELVEYNCVDVEVKGAWSGPAALQLNAHALAPVADLPVLEVLSGTHLIADLTLGLGEVAYDYLASDLNRARSASKTEEALLEHA
ncbi:MULTISPECIES: acetoacetate decarboxylase [unclassified Burkholderia]|uniref:acetoacetate decarboxylase n=1 Tax=unclassified Burkholderia TaxID=2613784 RepID=UPI000F55F403|nr:MULTISPECIES: acetoacetate decarboxylase [unclassified Burkholderia]RQR69833.1 acetoacetate decarboxylase [Burkholderia sp. Bp9012]RQR73326.1 acetoacetate decarboxylase [Burkholderia sp. Bp9011]RQR85185.1 acetoacetate decarboxylase [Burkholderia sp. Bp9010]RQZ40309.1 acetoacetate decarboxylase [Burkholderia sp. Bp9099]